MKRKMFMFAVIIMALLLIVGIKTVLDAPMAADDAGRKANPNYNRSDFALRIYENAFNAELSTRKSAGSIMAWVGGTGILISIYGITKSKEA